MGTRGLIGLRHKDKDQLTYNHYDSYPEELGVNFLKSIKKFSIEQMKNAFDNIKLIEDENKKPTKKEFEKYGKYGNPGVGGPMSNTKVKTYYQLLHQLQGNIEPYLSGEVDIMIESNNFIKDSLFCEWAYIVNLDTETLEIWRGFQKKNIDNRYKLSDKEIKEEENWWKKERNIDKKQEYFNCALVNEFSLSKLPTKEKFLQWAKKFGKQEDEDYP